MRNGVTNPIYHYKRRSLSGSSLYSTYQVLNFQFFNLNYAKQVHDNNHSNEEEKLEKKYHHDLKN